MTRRPRLGSRRVEGFTAAPGFIQPGSRSQPPIVTLAPKDLRSGRASPSKRRLTADEQTFGIPSGVFRRIT